MSIYTIKLTVLKFPLVALLLVFTVSQTSFVYAQETESLEDIYLPATEALTTFAISIAESLPKIIGAVILLIIGLIAGKIIGSAVQKISKKIIQKSEEKKGADSITIVEIPGKLDSARLISSTVRWFIYLFFIVAAVNALEFEQLTVALTDLWLWVPNLLAFVLIIIIGLIIVNFVSKWIDQELIQRDLGGSKYIITGVKVVIYGIIFAVALTQLGIGEDIIPILVSSFSWSISIAIGAAIAIGLGFAIKDIIPSMIGFTANKRLGLKEGQKVKIGDITGTITAIEALHIVVTDEKKETIIIPTKEIMNKTIRIISSKSKKA